MPLRKALTLDDAAGLSLEALRELRELRETLKVLRAQGMNERAKNTLLNDIIRDLKVNLAAAKLRRDECNIQLRKATDEIDRLKI